MFEVIAVPLAALNGIAIFEYNICSTNGMSLDMTTRLSKQWKMG